MLTPDVLLNVATLREHVWADGTGKRRNHTAFISEVSHSTGITKKKKKSVVRWPERDGGGKRVLLILALVSSTTSRTREGPLASIDQVLDHHITGPIYTAPVCTCYENNNSKLWMQWNKKADGINYLTRNRTWWGHNCSLRCRHRFPRPTSRYPFHLTSSN